MTRVLLTGSSGFVGGAFLRWFAAQQPDWLIDCVDVTPREQAAPREQVVQHWFDVRDWFHSDRSDPYDLVIHLAAVVGGRTKIDGSPLEVAVDLSIDAEFFQWVLRNRPWKAVYFSSSAAYEATLQTPGWQGSEFLSLANTLGYEKTMQLRECSPFPPFQDYNTRLGRVPDTGDVYGMVKAVGEQQAMLVAEQMHTYGGAMHVFRPFSGYGVGQALDYPVPAIVQRAARGDDPVAVWSDTVRDFIHIDDVVAASMAGVSKRRAPAPGTWTNLCTGVATSFTRLAALALEAVDGVSVDSQTRGIEVLGNMPRGPQYRVGDPRKMLKFYTPTVSLSEGIASMVTAHLTPEWETS